MRALGRGALTSKLEPGGGAEVGQAEVEVGGTLQAGSSKMALWRPGGE